MGKQTVSSLVSLIASATAADLEQLDAEIARIEQEIAAYAAERQGQLDALRAARKLLGVRINGKPQRKAREPGTKPEKGPSDLQEAIYDLLSREGSMPVPAIAARLNRPGQAIAARLVRATRRRGSHREGERHMSEDKTEAVVAFLVVGVLLTLAALSWPIANWLLP